MNKIRLTYHWSELWRSLLSLMRFLTTYASDVSSNPHTTTLSTTLVDLIAFCVSAGDTFLPDPASYDDLFYKLVETGPIISKFRDVYSLKPSNNNKKSTTGDITNRDIHVGAIETLISVSTHFYALLFNEDKSGAAAADDDSVAAPIPATQKKNLGPKEVHRIISQGYDTLSIQPPEGLSAWTKWREADWKTELKKAARCSVEDARELVA